MDLRKNIASNSLIIIVESSLVDVIVVKKVEVGVNRLERLAELLLNFKIEIALIIFLSLFIAFAVNKHDDSPRLISVCISASFF